MRVAVISDIHGDLDALRQVLTAIDRAATEQIWCVGDLVGLGATAPAEVVDLVRDRCALALAGNHDRWVTGQLSLSMLPLPRQRSQLQWAAPCALQRAARMARSAARRGLGSRHRAVARQRPGPNHRLDLKPARRGGSSRPPTSPDRARRAHPPTVDRREQPHDDRLRREPGQPPPRRRPSRSAQPWRRARIPQMARTRPRSRTRDQAHSVTGL